MNHSAHSAATPLQVDALQAVLRQSTVISAVLDRAPQLRLPHWYLGAGSIAQTVWNYLSGQDLTAHIRDLDLVYFDSDDLSAEREQQHAADARALLRDLAISADVKNQARVHLWHAARFGYAIQPYRSTEEAIDTWPTTATCIGVRSGAAGFRVYAPYGLDDLSGMIVRPNKLQITEAIYREKVARWTACWPTLRVIAW